MWNEVGVPGPHPISHADLGVDVPLEMLGKEFRSLQFQWVVFPCWRFPQLITSPSRSVCLVEWAMVSWMRYPYHSCATISMLGIATLWHVRLCEPSMLLWGFEIVVPLFPPAYLLLALWVWLVSAVLGVLWERTKGVFYQMNDFSFLVGSLKLISSWTLLRSRYL